MTTPVTTGTVPVNGLEMYYEIYGEGQPFVLLHGAFSAIDSSFGALIPGLAEGRKVVGFELQGHGRTADIDRPLSNEAMADDVAAAIEQMELGPVDLYGYSMGAFVALLVTLRHPQSGAQARVHVGHLHDERCPSRSDGGPRRDDARDDVRLGVA